MTQDLFIWRVLKAGMATMGELQTPGVWTLDDLMRANALLDAEIAEEHAATERTRKNKG